MLLQRRERAKTWNCQILWLIWRVRHDDIGFLLLGEEKQDTGFKIFVECRTKDAIRIVQISKSKLESQVNGEKNENRKRGGK